MVKCKDSMLFIILTGQWYVTVLNVHTPTEDKSDDTKDGFKKFRVGI
jgi:hypothetical protein